MIYGYARVSTKHQSLGTSLDHQCQELKNHGAMRIIKESHTATTSNRPKLQQLLSILRDGDTLIVTKLDRFARSTIDGVKIINNLLERGITIHILNMGIMDNTPSSKLMRSIFFAFAEFERDMIIERTVEGKLRKRESDPNYKEGRPRKIPINFGEMRTKINNKEISITDAVKRMNISRSHYYNLINN